MLLNLWGDVVDPVKMTIVSSSTVTKSLESLELTGTQTQRGLSDATADAVVSSDPATDNTDDHSTPMTPAVKGGIAAGAVAVVLALAVVAWVFVRERKRKTEGPPTDRDLKRAAFSVAERGGDYKGGQASPVVASGLRELPRGYMRPEPRETSRFELDGRGFASEEAVGRGKY